MVNTKYTSNIAQSIAIRGVEAQLKSFAVSVLDWVSFKHQVAVGFPSRKESPFSLETWICGPQNSVTLNTPIRPHLVYFPDYITIVFVFFLWVECRGSLVH